MYLKRRVVYWQSRTIRIAKWSQKIQLDLCTRSRNVCCTKYLFCAYPPDYSYSYVIILNACAADKPKTGISSVREIRVKHMCLYIQWENVKRIVLTSKKSYVPWVRVEKLILNQPNSHYIFKTCTTAFVFDYRLRFSGKINVYLTLRWKWIR